MLKPLKLKAEVKDQAIINAAANEQVYARFAHINALAKDANDIKVYEVDLDGNGNANIEITSKKGILDLENPANSISLGFFLQHPEIEEDRHKFYVQLTVYSTSFNCTPIVIGRGWNFNQFVFEVKDLTPIEEGVSDWGLLYVYYELVKID